MWQLTKANRQNEMWHWTIDQIGNVVQSRLWVQVGRMAWWLIQLESLTRVWWLPVPIPVSPTFYRYFRESVSGQDHVCQLIQQHSCDYLRKTSVNETWRLIKANSRNEMWHWTNNEIGVAIESWLWVRVEHMAS